MAIYEIINSIFTSKTYILYQEGEAMAWLVDLGDVEPVFAFLEARGMGVAGVLLTHAHFDHIYGLPALLRRFPQCRVVTNAAGLKTLQSSKRNLSRYHGTPIAVSPENVLLVQEGETVPLFGGLSARIYEAPGHHPSCLAFEIGDRLFTGDAYIPGTKVITNLPGGDKSQASATVARLLEIGRGKTILCGHWMDSTATEMNHRDLTEQLNELQNDNRPNNP